MEEKSLFYRLIETEPVQEGPAEYQLKKTAEKLLPLYEEYVSTKEITTAEKLDLAKFELSILKDKLSASEENIIYKSCEIECLDFLLSELKTKDFFDAKRAVELYADRLYRDEDRIKRERKQGTEKQNVKIVNEDYPTLETDELTYIAFKKSILVGRKNHPVKNMSEDKAKNFLKSDYNVIRKIIAEANSHKEEIANKEKEIAKIEEELTKPEIIAKDKTISSKNKSIETAFCNKLADILKEYYYAPTTKLKKQVFDSLYETRSENMKKSSCKTNLVCEETVMKLLGDFYNGLIKLEDKTQEKGL